MSTKGPILELQLPIHDLSPNNPMIGNNENSRIDEDKQTNPNNQYTQKPEFHTTY